MREGIQAHDSKTLTNSGPGLDQDVWYVLTSHSLAVCSYGWVLFCTLYSHCRLISEARVCVCMCVQFGILFDNLGVGLQSNFLLLVVFVVVCFSFQGRAAMLLVLF